MKRLLNWLGVAISIVCVCFFAHSIAHHWKAIADARWNAQSWTTLAIATAMYVSTYCTSAFAWNSSLQALRHPLEYLVALRIQTISQFAKYLPGNVGQHVGRLVMTKRQGLPIEVILGSMLLDTLVILMAAALCSLSVISLVLSVAGAQRARTIQILEIAALVGTCVIISSALLPVTRSAVHRTFHHFRHLARFETIPLLTRALIAHVVSLFAGGIALYLLCGALTDRPVQHWLQVVGMYSAAWLLGFLMPGAPAGLGVREVVLLLGLGPIYGAETATAASAAMRVVTTIGDGLAFIFGLGLKKSTTSPKPAPPAQSDDR